ncbi:uncharacterized protein LOC122067336 [Macadamia integrifolia]|uniref:uncharacterized protein LOC122067336 n=1 Tax=Macadamia integrifolia TaxID=60698 RepID=UPI001C4E3961|nr:uncharacterized protein LOC122067336 [Macadamia integrifolia]
MSEQKNSTESDDQVAASAAAAAAAAAAASSTTTPSKQQPKIAGDSNEYKKQQKPPPEADDDDGVIELKDKESGKKIQVELQDQSSSPSTNDDIEKEAAADIYNNSDGKGDEDESGRERLKRHHKEVAGRVWIPEKWGKEELLKDWIDCSAFNASLVPTGIMSARAALIQEGPPPKFRWN